MHYQVWFTGEKWVVEVVEEGIDVWPIAQLFDDQENADRFAALMNGEEPY